MPKDNKQISKLKDQLSMAEEQRGLLEGYIVDAHFRAFGSRHYAYVDCRSACDLLVADIKATQHERDIAISRSEAAEKELAKEKERSEFWEETSNTADRVRNEQFSECMKLHDGHVRMIHALTAQVSDLRAAGEALVQRWDTPGWKDVPHTGVFINALRAALARTPAQSLAAHDSAVLRDLADGLLFFVDAEVKQMLRMRADQIEAEAKGEIV